MRILKSHPLISLENEYLVDSPEPSNIRSLWNFGSLLGFCLVIQIVTGVTLAMHYNPSVLKAYNSFNLLLALIFCLGILLIITRYSNFCLYIKDSNLSNYLLYVLSAILYITTCPTLYSFLFLFSYNFYIFILFLFNVCILLFLMSNPTLFVRYPNTSRIILLISIILIFLCIVHFIKELFEYLSSMRIQDWLNPSTPPLSNEQGSSSNNPNGPNSGGPGGVGVGGGVVLLILLVGVVLLILLVGTMKRKTICPILILVICLVFWRLVANS